MSRQQAATQPRRQASPRKATESKPDLRVVQEDERRISTGALGVLTFAVVFAGLLGAVLFHSVVVAGQLELDELNDQLDEERTRGLELRVQVAELEAPDRILREAGRLGMVFPAAEAYVNGFPLGVEELLPPGGDPFSLDGFDRSAAAVAEESQADEDVAGESLAEEPAS